MPSNTLLEPNNVIPSWEFGDEENKEVSATLRRIRQKYDNIHKTVLAKEKELERKTVSKIWSLDWWVLLNFYLIFVNIQRELEMAKNEEQSIEDRVERKTNGLENTAGTLDGIKRDHEYQMMV